MNETIHVVRIEEGKSVYGHETTDCKKHGACDDLDRFWYVHIEAGNVEAGHTYEFDEQGSVVREI